MARISSRLAALSGSVTPPGITHPVWMRLVPSSSMMCWPKRRSPMPARPSSGLAAATPKMWRCAGSDSMPSSRSGEERWKKLSACDCTICARFEHAAQLRGGVRNAHRHDGFAGFGRGEQVRDGADAADARREAGHLVERPAFGEFLEAAHLGHVKVCVFHLALGVQLDGDLAVSFKAGDGIDGDGLGHNSSSMELRLQSG